MPNYKYLIIGGGMAADAAVRGIRDIDTEGSIGLISAEQDPPYKRPPLSKKLWQGKLLDSVWSKTEKQNLEMHLGHRVRTLDPGSKQVEDHQGTVYTFDKLLLATGGSPRRLPFDSGGEAGVIYFRTVEDYRRLRQLADERERFAVIGGGLIGSEMAAALAMNGRKVTLIVSGDTIGDRLYPSDLGRFLNGYYEQKGVEVLTHERAAGLEARGGQYVLKTTSGRELTVDGIVAGLGIEPEISLAREAGLAIEDGIVVDQCLQTSAPDIYAAGDVAAFWDVTLGKRRRVEHEDNAKTMGRHAGRVMAGEVQPYDHTPYFYSDLFDLGYEAVGDIDPRLETVADWKEPYREGVVYYMDKGRVRGVLLWNVWHQVDAARRLIAEPGPFRAEDLQGRLPEASQTTS
ncbi:MAG: 3-phenylpropionate/trans-cinnamate dioxygenase ferredoxin reductase component [Chloroflexia bacterium]|jgi:NADPH-dependent 2,4-dienoyl-CoA reductase/sulfur reductase-like enzyme|nr:3-phenylpropionate/trans-cinnamate dioxygenase ferredoxin reductase component [Chloroflexia bacterium]